jgi:hypothetical protein
MTLIVAVGNPDQFVQVSDRRLTWIANGEVITDESNKAIILYTDDARLIGGYSGLAFQDSFITRDWILDTLYECAEPDRLAENILLRFKDRASEKFTGSPSLRDQPLSVMFSGYHDHYDPPLAFQIIVSNYMDANSNYKSIDVQNSFQYMMRPNPIPLEEPPLLNSWIGMPFKMLESDKHTLKELIISRKPASAIESKLVDVFHKYANLPVSRGTVGEQLTSIILPRSRDGIILFDYHTSYIKPELYAPDILYLTRSGRQLLKDLVMEPDDAATTLPLSVPKLKSNEPCPCGSGLRFGECHGSKKAGKVPFAITIGSDKSREHDDNIT